MARVVLTRNANARNVTETEGKRQRGTREKRRVVKDSERERERGMGMIVKVLPGKFK